jgi:hypothetical protein
MMPDSTQVDLPNDGGSILQVGAFVLHTLLVHIAHVHA